MSAQEYIQITEVLNESLTSLSETSLSDSGFGDALQYIIDTCTAILPAPSTVNLLIFELLMKNCSTTKLDEVGVFLQNLLVAIPLKNPDFEYDYKMAILDQRNIFPDLWSILVHLIESSLCHRGIRQHGFDYQPQLVNYPVCDLLFHFYVEFILKFLSLKRDLFEDAYYPRRRDLMQWINEFYKFHVEEVEILKDLHNLLDQTVNSEVMGNASCSAAVALNQTSVFDAVLEIFTICKDVFTSYNKFVQFLNYSKLVYLSASICHHILHEITKKKRLPIKKSTALTLKELIRCFFFIRLPSQKKRRQPPVFFIKKRSICLKKRRHKEKVKKLHIQSLVVDDTKIHKMCRNNLMGDLLNTLLMRKRMNLNRANYAGQTPLHIACISSYFICAKFLLDPSIGKRHKPLDIAAVDKQNCTPLHYAVMANDKDIVRILLQQGGEELLHKKDYYNLKPHDYAVSQDMIDMLRDFFPSVCLDDELSDDDCDTEEFEISTIRSKKNYFMYLYALHSLLCYYFDIFQLFTFRGKVVSVEEHDKLACSHFTSSAVNVICIEDYCVIHRLPKYIEELIGRVERDARKIEIDVKKQVRLLKLFSQTISSVK